MRPIIRFTAAVLSCLAVLAAPALAQTADTARTKGAAWLVAHQRGDGAWVSSSGGLEAQATATALIALKNAGLGGSPSFGAALGWLGNADADSVDSIARIAEALGAAGARKQAQAGVDRLYAMRSSAGTATWNGYGWSGLDVVDTALGFRSLRSADAAYAAKVYAASGNTIKDAWCKLIDSRVPVASGKQAWPVVPKALAGGPANKPSVLATALLLFELRQLEKTTTVASFTCGATTYPLATLQAEARDWLLDQKNPDNGFGEQRNNGTKGPSSVLVSSIVYRALASLASVPAAAPTLLTWLLNQQDAGGSWKNDSFVTASVVAVLPSASGADLTDTDRDGLTDVVEVQAGSNVSVADARGALGSPTLGTSGTASAYFAVGATVGVPFSYNLSGGTQFLLLSGSMPPGLNQPTSAGLITGTPLVAGNFGFTYQYAVSGGFANMIGLIDVARRQSSIVLAPDQNPTDKFRNTQLTATVTGTQPQGTVEFLDGAAVIATVSLAEGAAGISAGSSVFVAAIPLQGGFRKLTARYLGDGNNEPSTSPVVHEIVNPDAAAIINTILQMILD